MQHGTSKCVQRVRLSLMLAADGLEREITEVKYFERALFS